VKRFLYRLPYLGWLLIVVLLLVRSFRTEGLDLPHFPVPPQVNLPEEVLASSNDGIMGRVVDFEANPIAEALVMVHVGGELTWDYSDEQGYFTIPRLAPGPRDITVVARKYAAKLLPNLTASPEIVIDMGESVGAPPSLPAIGQSDLAGKVSPAIAGRGLLGYEVQMIPLARPETIGAPTPARTSVAADRTFKFPGLLHGEYRLVVLPPFARAGSWPNLVDSGQKTLVHGPVLKQLEIQLGAGEIAGRLTDHEGEFVAGALIMVEPSDDPGRPWPPVQSDDAGGFRVEHLPPGHYRLQVIAGEARLEEIIEVLSGVTSEVDLPALLIRKNH
jgi:hypothetical protein